MDEPLSWQELLIAVFSCGLVVLYHIYLFIELKYAPHRCSLGMHFAERYTTPALSLSSTCLRDELESNSSIDV